jgi:hypothetical protein
MTEHAVMLKRTDIIYVYDSDDDKIRKRRDRRRRILKRKKANVLRVRNKCGTCGNTIPYKCCIKIDNTTYMCLSCAIEVSGV